jgi:serine/threonine-protein kinase
MTAERWLEVERLFHAAAERQPDARPAFLRHACGADERLYAEVQSLLDESSPGDSFLENPAIDFATTYVERPKRPSMVGRRLREYELQAQLGAGGMGEVYRARDRKLGRDVAIKVLPAPLAHDRDRVARFRREAQILATLNHPHIAAIYALEEVDDVLGLVLELVDGPTLAERLSTGPLAVREAVTVARQMAAALEAAHEKGIVHRDLKPANIKLTLAGTVKVLDFGLAKALADRALPDAGLGPVDATREGVIVGTATYMSPEQARGLALDQRTDIWAFGCVLYETLAGRKAFSGKSVADCMAAILQREPDWNALPSSTPASVIELLRRCLEKDSARRLGDIRDAFDPLDEVLADHPGRVRTLAGASVRRRSPRAAILAVTAATLIASAFAFRWIRAMTVRPVAIDLALANTESIVPTHSSEVALSPDGNMIAYATIRAMANMPDMTGDPAFTSMPAMPMNEQIYVRPTGRDGARPIGGAVGSGPFFSPDSQWVGFWHASTATLRRVAVSGGAPVRICSAPSGMAGATWGPDGTIVFAWFDLLRVAADGGSPSVLLKVDEQRGERFYRHPSFLPSGKAIVFTIGKADTDSYDDSDIAVLSLDTGKKKILVEGGTSPRYSPSGHLIYARGGKLLAVRLDAQTLEVTGQPFEVADGVFMSATTGMAAYGISRDGHLVYAAGPVERGARVPVWVDRHGRRSALPLPPRPYLHPRLSPNGHQVAIEVEGASHDIFTYDLDRAVLTKMSFDGASHWPLWTPRGDRLTFRSWKTGTMTMWTMPADGSGPPELLTSLGSMQSPESWSPDGGTLAFTQMDDAESGSDIYVLPMKGDRRPRPLVRTKFSEGSPKFSPDGRWVVYSSNESGRPEIYAMAYPGPGPKIQISTDGGTDPVWRHDEREVFYRNGDLMMGVDVIGGQTLTASKPRVLWEGHYLAGVGSSCGMSGPTSANYDVSADGQRFLMIEDTAQNVECKRLHVVSNWSRELTARPATSAALPDTGLRAEIAER